MAPPTVARERRAGKVQRMEHLDSHIHEGSTESKKPPDMLSVFK